MISESWFSYIKVRRIGWSYSVFIYSHDEPQNRDYQPYKPQRRYVEDIVRSGFCMEDASELTENRDDQTYLHLLLDMLR